MERIQSLLKETRERKGITLKDVEAETRIPLHYLEMLEGGGDSRFLADQMYLIPALRTYAAFLGLNPATAVAQFVTDLQRIEASANRSERAPEPSAQRPPPSRFLSRAVFLLLFISILAFVWQYSEIESWWPSEDDSASPSLARRPASDSPAAPALWTEPSPSSSPSSPGETETAEVSPALPAVSPSLAPTPQAESSPELSSPSPPSPAPEAPHILRVRATERTWMRVTIDEQRPKDFLLKPGQEVEWTAQDGFTLTVGNAGGIQLSLDGQPLPPLGKSGQVLRNIQLPSRG